MSPLGRRRVARLLCYGSLGAIGLLAAGRLIDAGAAYWWLAAAVTVGTVLLGGPAAWVARQRVPDGRRERFGYVLAAAGMLAIPLLLGVGLVAGASVRLLDAGVLGGVVGLALVLAVERTVVPARLRGAGP